MRKVNSDIEDDSCEEDERDVQISSSGNGKVSTAIIPRPNTSGGYWMCTLLPLAFATSCIQVGKCSESTPCFQKMLAIAAAGMCIETLCFFLYMFIKSGLLLKLFIAFVPGLVTTVLYVLFLKYSWSSGLFWGFAVTFCYQNTYIRVMRGMPRSFSFGEAALLVQGLMLFVLNVVLKLPSVLFDRKVLSDFDQLNSIMMFALSCLMVACCVLSSVKTTRTPYFVYFLMVVLVLIVTCSPITEPIPIIALVVFLTKDSNRIIVIIFYLLLVTLSVTAVWCQIDAEEKASTSVRKVFHVFIVLVYLPGLFYQCDLLYIASGVALAIFIVLELFRVLNIMPLSLVLRKAFASFSDEKDAGIIALTPFCLLIGCSLPIWISPCPCDWGESNKHSSNKILPLMAGILTIGFGDTAASVFGSKFGRTKWRNSSRTLEGTIAFIFTVLTALFCLDFAGYIPMTNCQWLVAFFATTTTAIIEAHTDQIDNIALPLIFLTITNLLSFQLKS